MPLNLLHLFLFLAVFAPQVYAEKADRRKPLVIDATAPTGDNKAKIYKFENGITLTQGTLKMIGDAGEVRGEPPRYIAKLTGSPVCFRQKKDGSDEIMRGQADRMEYDQAKEKVEFFGRVIVHDGPNEMRSDYVVYYMNSEKFELREKPNKQTRMVVISREKDAPENTPGNELKTTLKTTKEIEAERYEPLASKCLKEAL